MNFELIEYTFTENRADIINEFIQYCRQNNYIVIDLNKLQLCVNYRELFGKIYLQKFIKNPKQFISYQRGVCFLSSQNQVNIWQIQSKKYFKTYLFSLTNKLNYCDRCIFLGRKKTTEVRSICNNCQTTICVVCQDELTGYLYRYFNYYRCFKCQNLNKTDL